MRDSLALHGGHYHFLKKLSHRSHVEHLLGQQPLQLGVPFVGKLIPRINF
jgi:hypothetical protein